MNREFSLRDLELSDLDFLESIENDSSLWKYSNTIKPFSIIELKDFIINCNQELDVAGQKRFLLEDKDSNKLGFFDLFDYDKKNARAAVGLVISKEYRGRGFSKIGLQLLENIALKDYCLHQLYAGVGTENIKSRNLFISLGFIETGVKKDWNYYDNKFHDEIIFQKILDV